MVVQQNLWQAPAVKGLEIFACNYSRESVIRMNRLIRTPKIQQWHMQTLPSHISNLKYNSVIRKFYLSDPLVPITDFLLYVLSSVIHFLFVFVFARLLVLHQSFLLDLSICEGHVFQKVMIEPKPRGVCSCICGV